MLSRDSNTKREYFARQCLVDLFKNDTTVSLKKAGNLSQMNDANDYGGNNDYNPIICPLRLRNAAKVLMAAMFYFTT